MMGKRLKEIFGLILINITLVSGSLNAETVYADTQAKIEIEKTEMPLKICVDEENKKMVEMGVRKFEPAKEAKISRLKRSARRNNGRKKWRKQQKKWLKHRKPDCRKDRRSHVYRACGRNRAD